MVAFPETQKKAQEELNSVVGRQRFPTLDDLQNLPYIRAIIREVRASFFGFRHFFRTHFVLKTHRFRPVTPLLIPHANIAQEEVIVSLSTSARITTDDTLQYKGFIIPEGSTIFVNICASIYSNSILGISKD
jgi:hypothetical protein